MLERLHEIDWATIEGCFGVATYVPNAIQSLIVDDPHIQGQAEEDLYFGITYWGRDVSEAVVHVIPFLFEILEGEIPANKLFTLRVIGFCLSASTTKNHKYSDIVYELLHDKIHVLRNFLSYQDPAARTTVVSILTSFRDDPDSIIAWIQNTITVENHVKAKIDQLSLLASYFKENYTYFGSYEEWYLSHIEPFLTDEHPPLIRLIAATSIVEVIQSRTDPKLVGSILDLLVEWNFPHSNPNIMTEWSRFCLAPTVFQYLGLNRCVEAYLQLVTRVANPEYALDLANELIVEVFPYRGFPFNPIDSFTMLQKSVLVALVENNKIWQAQSKLIVKAYGLPESRSEIQQILMSYNASDGP